MTKWTKKQQKNHQAKWVEALLSDEYAQTQDVLTAGRISSMTRPKTAPYTRPIPDYGDLMTVEEYMDVVRCGGFIDYDGNGIAAKDGMMDGRNIFLEHHVAINPSDGLNYIPEDATHIVWFNK